MSCSRSSAMRSTCAAGGGEFGRRGRCRCASRRRRGCRPWCCPLHGDDEGEAEFLDIGGVELGEAARARRRSARRGRRRPVRRVDSARQALGLRQLAGEVGMGVEHAEPLVLAGRCGRPARSAKCRPPARVVRRAEFAARRRVRRSRANARRRRRSAATKSSRSMREGRSAGAP